MNNLMGMKEPYPFTKDLILQWQKFEQNGKYLKSIY